MLSKEENELLTRVGPGTPAGEMLRRYWWPVGFTEQVKLKGSPTRVRLLSEDLVLFRIARTVGLPWSSAESKIPAFGAAITAGSTMSAGDVWISRQNLKTALSRTAFNIRLAKLRKSADLSSLTLVLNPHRYCRTMTCFSGTTASATLERVMIFAIGCSELRIRSTRRISSRFMPQNIRTWL